MRRGLVLAVSALLILGSCSLADEPDEAVEPSPLYADEQSAWRQAGINSYRIQFSMRNLNGMGGSSGDGRFDVTVRDNRRTECTAEDTLDQSRGFCDSAIPDPVSFLFSRLAVFNPDYTRVVFDSEWHFPELIEYDEPGSVDEEYRIRVHEFEEL